MGSLAMCVGIRRTVLSPGVFSQHSLLRHRPSVWLSVSGALPPPSLPLSHSVCRSPLPVSSLVISHLPPRTVNGVTIRLTASDTFIKNESCPQRRAPTQTTKMITPSCLCELTAAHGVPDPNLRTVGLRESDTLGDVALSYPQSVLVFFLNSKLP